MRRRRASWSCSSLRYVTTLLCTRRSTTKNSNPICHALSLRSGTFWFPPARKSNMTWWEDWSVTDVCVGLSSISKTHPFSCCSWSATPSSSWLRSARGHTTSTCLRTRTRSQASVRRSLFPTWSSEVSHAHLISRAVLSCCGDADRICAGADEEAFEDNSEEYIRRDLEGSGKEFSLPPSVTWWKAAPWCLTLVTIFPLPCPSSDIDTRRRAACDLVRGLCKFFEGPVTAIFSGYVNSMLAEYAKNPGQNWKHKDAAIYLVTSLASKGQTQKVWASELRRERHTLRGMLLFNLPFIFPPFTARNHTSQSVGESQWILSESHSHRPKITQR